MQHEVVKLALARVRDLHLFLLALLGILALAQRHDLLLEVLTVPVKRKLPIVLAAKGKTHLSRSSQSASADTRMGIESSVSVSLPFQYSPQNQSSTFIGGSRLVWRDVIVFPV